MGRFLAQIRENESKLSDVDKKVKSENLKDIRWLAQWRDPEMMGEWG